MKLKHVIKSQQFDRDLLTEIFNTSQQMESVFENGQSKLLSGKILASLFYEPSTRTRLSFESAMMRLGGRIITTENAKEFSSAAKGENIEDTIRVVQSYADAIVIRHHESGTAEKASLFSDIPIINAGDGPGQHPTQALTDLYTIQKELGTIDDISIAMVGDLQNGRTVRSLCYLLSKYKNIKVYFVSPDVVKMRDDIKDYLTKYRVSFTEESNLLEVAKKVDVIYQTRIQKERFSNNPEDFEKAIGKYIIDESVLNVMKDKSIIMHPLPRLNEISNKVDSDPRAAYFRQAKNAIYVRGALLKHLLT
jgi:aspartate carbamoyltransferase catalytic subunit